MAAGKWLRLDRNYLSKPEFREITATPEGMGQALIYASLIVAYGEYVPCDKDVLASRLRIEPSGVKDALNAFFKKGFVTVLDSRPRTRFNPPTLEEVKAYCAERKSDVKPNKFFDYYEAVGWKKGSTQIEDWQAALRCWEKESKPEETGECEGTGLGEEYIQYLQSLRGRI